MIGTRLELQILIISDKRVQEESYSKERDDKQSEVYTFVEVDMFESLLLSEGRTVNFSSILDLLLHIDFSVGILHMQDTEEFLCF